MSVEKLPDHLYETVPTEENVVHNETNEIPKYGYGVRHVQSLISFVCLTAAFMARGHLGVTIVAMVDPATYRNITTNGTDDISNHLNGVFEDVNMTDYAVAIGGANDSDVEALLISSAFDDDLDVDSAWNVNRMYIWPIPEQEMILSSFFLGYLVMMIPMGWVTQRFGGKLPIQLSLFINGIVSILTPWVVAWGGWKAACGCRILQGLSQAGTYPGVISLLSAWVPACERGTLSTYVFSGVIVGTVMAFQVGGLLAGSAGGWPTTFWVTGAMCLAAFALISGFGAATPREHVSISEAERRFILGDTNSSPVKGRRTPWAAVLRSRHVWAIFAMHVGSGTCFYFILTQVSSYLHYVLGFDIGKSGLLSSLPYIASFFSSIAMGSLSDYLTNRKIIRVRHARMLFNTIAGTGLAMCIAAVSFVTSTTLAVACLVLSMIAHSGMHTGFMVNYMDLSPNYSGSMVAIGNTLMNLVILVLPMLVSNIVTDVTNPYQWRVMLLLVAGLSLVANAVNVAFMSAELQPWDSDLHGAATPDTDEVEAVKEAKK